MTSIKGSLSPIITKIIHQYFCTQFLIYFNFNNELYQFDNVKCLKPKGVINYCYPNSDKLNKYSILDFTKSTELIDIGKNHHHCMKINYC